MSQTEISGTLMGNFPILTSFCRAKATRMDSWSFNLVLLLVAPLLEEYVLRAGLQSAWIRQFAGQKTDRSLAGFNSASIRIFAVAALFSLAHCPRGIWLAIGTFPVALFIGWWFEHRQSWLECALLHSAANAFWLFAAPGLGVFQLLNQTQGVL